MDKASLTGQAYKTDAAEVHTYIVNFTSENPEAEAKLVPHAQQNNGSIDFIALKNHYKGVRVHAINIIQADKVHQDILYVVEKNPHIWWDEFKNSVNGCI